LPVCELCMKGEGDVCHAPGCVCCRHDVIKNLKHFAISTKAPPTFITTDKKLIALSVSASKIRCDYLKFARTIVSHTGGRVIDVVALSMACLSAVLNNEYMDKQLDGIQVAILNAIEGVDTEGG